MRRMKKDAFKKWVQAYKNLVSQSRENVWPSETLIRIVRGDYIPEMDKDFEGKKVLDVGCGTGNNLMLFASLGMGLYGCEVGESIVKLARERLRKCGYNADIRVGENRNLPFDSNFFDYLVSWNVIHYEENKKNMDEAIAEYARVLKPRGRIFVSTTGPQHMILKDAKLLGNHRYRIGRSGEFRKGQVYFYFDTPEYIKLCFSEWFRDILVGRVNDYLFTEYQDYFIITGTCKK